MATIIEIREDIDEILKDNNTKFITPSKMRSILIKVVDFVDSSSLGDQILQDGNSFGEEMYIGTDDAYSFALKTNGVKRFTVTSSGRILVNTTTEGTYQLDVNGGISANNNSIIGTAEFTPNDSGNVSFKIKTRTGIYVANTANNFGIEYGGGRIYANIGYGSNNPSFTPSAANWTTNATFNAHKLTSSSSSTDAFLVGAIGGVIRATGADRGMEIRGGEGTDNPLIHIYGKSSSGSNAGIIKILNTTGIMIGTSAGLYVGVGDPNGVVTANPGSLYLNTSGGASVSIYIKESGSATNTGWVAK